MCIRDRVEFTPVFAHLFNDTYAIVRVAALDGVWDSTEPRLVRPIIGLLQSDRDVNVRAAAARALAHYVLLAEWGQVDTGAAVPIAVSYTHLDVYKRQLFVQLVVQRKKILVSF